MSMQLTSKRIDFSRSAKEINSLPKDIVTRGCQSPEVQFCTTERPQLFEFEVATCRTCKLRTKKAILEVATSNLQK